jgi:hypothetical protein
MVDLEGVEVRVEDIAWEGQFGGFIFLNFLFKIFKRLVNTLKLLLIVFSALKRWHRLSNSTIPRAPPLPAAI